MPAMMPEENAALAEKFKGARVLITGGLGFIGSALALRLVAMGSEVALIDNLLADSGANPFNIQHIRDRVLVEIRDMREPGAVAPLVEGRQYLFNLAAQTSHLGSMEDPVTDLDINCRAQLLLLEACRARAPGISIVFASTRQIYGKADYLPVDEKHPLRPPDVNGINKMAGEIYHLLYHQAYGIPVSALRLTNTYGPRMRIKDARQNFLGIWLRRVLEGEPFEVWGGEQIRDFTYVDDVVTAFLLAATVPAAQGRVFNIGAERAVSLAELARLVIEANGGGDFATKSFPPERKRIDIGDYQADDRLFRDATGWRPSVPLEAGLVRALAFFRENLAHYV
jgi:UDP-glucose 4-epimerase